MPIHSCKDFITEFDINTWTSSGCYVAFGDNLERWGRGGFAKLCRNKKNCIGIATKKAPSLREDSFFSDKPIEIESVKNDLSKLEELLKQGNTVIVPMSREGTWNIGTGLADCPERSPKIFKMIQTELFRMEKQYAEKKTP